MWHALAMIEDGSPHADYHCSQAIDCGSKRITVNAVAPGAIKTDMYRAVAREYIPGGAKFTDEEVDKVGSFQIGFCPDYTLTTFIVCCMVVTSGACRSACRYRSGGCFPGLRCG